MEYDPTLAALLAQPWSNGACRGYVIYAMEECGFKPEDIQRVVGELHYIFDMRGLAEAEEHYKTAPISFETHCPKLETGTRAAPNWCRSCAFPHLDKWGALFKSKRQKPPAIHMRKLAVLSTGQESVSIKIRQLRCAKEHV